MQLKTVCKVGSVSIRLHQETCMYYLSYWDSRKPNGGGRVQESTRVRATTQRQRDGGATVPVEVQTKARELNSVLHGHGRKYLLAKQNPTVEEAIELAIEHCRAKTDGRREDLTRFGVYFVEFLREQYPGLRHWVEIQPSHVKGFIKHHSQRGVSAKSLKHYSGVVTVTANHWANECPDLFRPLNVKSNLLDSPRKPVKHYLTAKQLSYLLTLANERKSAIETAAVILGGYAGLNLLEIARLTGAAFDTKAKSLTITESKNQFRERTIPLLSLVCDYVATLDRKYPNSLLFHNAKAAPADHNTFGRAVRRLLNDAAKRTKDNTYSEVDPKDLRKTFSNLCVEAGVPEPAIGGIMGHRPDSITARHYADFGQLDYLRREVINRLESYLAEQTSTATILDIKAA